MKIALVIGEAQGNAISPKLASIRSNLDIECYTSVDKLIEASLKRGYFYDRILIMSTMITERGQEELYNYWSKNTRGTGIVMLCRKNKDDFIATSFMNQFRSQNVTTAMVTSTTMQLLDECISKSVVELQEKYGLKDLVNIELDDSVSVNIDIPKEKEQTPVQRVAEQSDNKGKRTFLGTLFGTDKAKQKQSQTHQVAKQEPIPSSPFNNAQVAEEVPQTQNFAQDNITEHIPNNARVNDEYSFAPVSGSDLGNDFYTEGLNTSEPFSEQGSDFDFVIPGNEEERSDSSVTSQTDDDFFSNPVIQTESSELENTNNGYSEFFSTGTVTQDFDKDAEPVESFVTPHDDNHIDEDVNNSYQFGFHENEQNSEPENFSNELDTDYSYLTEGSSDGFSCGSDMIVEPVVQKNNEPVVENNTMIPQQQKVNMSMQEPVQTQYNQQNQQITSQQSSSTGQINYGRRKNDNPNLMNENNRVVADADFGFYSNQNQSTQPETQPQTSTVNTDFSDLVAQEGQSVPQEQPKVVTKTVVREIIRDIGAEANSSVLQSIISGRRNKIIVVTGDRGTGVTSTALNIANFFSNHVPVLYFDCDTENHGLLNYIDYDTFRDYDSIQLNGVSSCKTPNAFRNCVVRFSKNFDMLTTDWSFDVPDTDIVVAQKAVLANSQHYGIVIVDCPISKLHCIDDLLLAGEVICCVEASRRGFMNMLCRMESSKLDIYNKQAVANKGTMFITKCLKDLDLNTLYKNIQCVYTPDEVDWLRMKTVPFNGKLTDSILKLVLEG